MKSILNKTIAMFAFVAIAQSSHATEYQVNVSGDFNKPSYLASVFGITNTTTPVEMSFVVDTTLGAITNIPQGSPINPSAPLGSQYTYSTNLTFVPASAIKNLGVTIGTSNWLTTNLFEQDVFGNLYGVLLGGNLTNGNVTSISLLLINSVGEMVLGSSICNNILRVCTIDQTGFAFDYNMGDGGTISSVSATITELVGSTTDSKLIALSTMVESANTTKAVKIVLGSHIKLAQKHLKEGNAVALTNALETFIQMTETFSGKTLTPADAAALKAKAQEALDTLT